MKKFLIETLIGLPVVILVAIVLELAYCAWITHHPFELSARMVMIPVSVWVVMEAILCIVGTRGSDRKQPDEAPKADNDSQDDA